MNITQLPSGSYNIRLQKNKRKYSFTIDHKPTKKEIEAILKEKVSKVEAYNKSLYVACKEYIDANDKVLSPSTIRDYTNRLERMYKDYYDFMMTDVNFIDKHQLQKFVNDYSATHSPKMTRNTYSLILVGIKEFRDDFSPRINMPQKIKTIPYIPTDNDITLLLQYVNNTINECAIKLLLCGLRISELRALTMADIGDGLININKAKVKGLDGYVVKTTKTISSTRIVKVSKNLTDKIKAQGFIIKGGENVLRKVLNRYQKEYNIPHFSIHKLRHYFCSTLVNLQVPTPYIMQMGGWATDTVMKTVYTHALTDKDYSNKGIEFIDALENKKES